MKIKRTKYWSSAPLWKFVIYKLETQHHSFFKSFLMRRIHTGFYFWSDIHTITVIYLLQFSSEKITIAHVGMECQASNAYRKFKPITCNFPDSLLESQCDGTFDCLRLFQTIKKIYEISTNELFCDWLK